MELFDSTTEFVRSTPSRATEGRLVAFAPDVAAAKRELKRFLYENLYFHPRVRAMSDHGAQILGELFATFREDPEQLPSHVRDRFREDGEARAIADYAAGMTDRFAIFEHERLVGAHGRT
jgi:dGTPase